MISTTSAVGRTEGEDHIVYGPRKVGPELLVREQFAENHVAHAKAHRGNRFPAQGLRQTIVAPATAQGAQLSCRIECLEHDARIVCQAADHRCVEDDFVAQTEQALNNIVDVLNETKRTVRYTDSRESANHLPISPGLGYTRCPSRCSNDQSTHTHTYLRYAS